MSTLTIGADPEFASSGCAQGKWRWGEVGLDGAGVPTYELRPEPSQRADDVVNNITALLGKAASCYTSLPAVGFAGPYAFDRPLGGHIHLGHPQLMEELELCRDLADVLAGLLSPIIYVAGGRGCRLRREDDYGYPNDFRAQPHGMEWRAPFSWLWDPDLALDILWLTGTVADLFLTYGNESDWLKPGRYESVIYDIDELLQACDDDAMDELREIAEVTIPRLGSIVTELAGSWLADEVVHRARRVVNFEPLPFYANIFARWKIDPSVSSILTARWDPGWVHDLGRELALAVGAYRVIFYGISQHRENVRLSCNGLALKRQPGGWDMATGYGRYECVPNGVIAIGVPWSMRDDSSADSVVRNAVAELIAAAKEEGEVDGDDYDYYCRLFREYREFNEEEEYYEEDDEEELEEEEEGNSDQDVEFQPLLLIPTSCYLNL